MSDEPIEVVDRYSALGLPRHPVKLVCTGPCEGTGVFPVYMSEGDRHRDLGPMAVVVSDEDDPSIVALWRAAEAKPEARCDCGHVVEVHMGRSNDGPCMTPGCSCWEPSPPRSGVSS